MNLDKQTVCKKIGIIFNNDGKAGAFNRMVPSVGGIALRQLGAIKNAVQTLLLTLENCKGLALPQLYG